MENEKAQYHIGKVLRIKAIIFQDTQNQSRGHQLRNKREADEINNLLYALHTVPITDCIGLATSSRK